MIIFALFKIQGNGNWRVTVKYLKNNIMYNFKNLAISREPNKSKMLIILIPHYKLSFEKLEVIDFEFKIHMFKHIL